MSSTTRRPFSRRFVAAPLALFRGLLGNLARDADFILRKKEFKVVISDHLMPGGNGMSFLVRAREEYPKMSRILVTGYMKPEMLMRSVNEAALFRYLLKPVTFAELIKVVQEAARADGLDGGLSAMADPGTKAPAARRSSSLSTTSRSCSRRSARSCGESCRAAHGGLGGRGRPAGRGARRYDVIVCDHMLPGEQGLDFLIRHDGEGPVDASGS